MRSFKGRGSTAHLVKIHFLWIEADTILQKRLAYGRIQDPVDILFFYTAADCIKGRRAVPGFPDGNISRQPGVHRKRNPVCRDPANSAEVCAVMPRMDACIRSSAAYGFHPVTAHLRQRSLQRFLNGSAMFPADRRR